jgi:hypothetical protein
MVYCPSNFYRKKFTLSQSESISQKIVNFYNDRIAKIVAGETPVPLMDKRNIVLHLFPVTAFDGSGVDVTSQARNFPKMLTTLTNRNPYPRYNFDGLLCAEKYMGQQYDGYLQLYRHGIIEVVDALMLSQRPKEDVSTVIQPHVIEKHLIENLKNYLSLLNQIEITPPIFLMITFLNVAGAIMWTNNIDIFLSTKSLLPYNRNIMSFPEIELQSIVTEDADKILRPIFDVMWQAAGQEKCPHYNAEGKWVERTKTW